jgi:hypothetical protein
MTERVELVGEWQDRDIRMHILGYGQVAITHALKLADGTPCAMLLIEPDLGSGEIGAPVPLRQQGTAVYPVDGSTVLRFDRASSATIVIKALEKIRRHLEQQEAGE